MTLEGFQQPGGKKERKEWPTVQASDTIEWAEDQPRHDNFGNSLTTPPDPQNGLLRRRMQLMLQIAGGVLLLLVLATILALYQFKASFAERIYPNISIQGIYVGELSQEQTKEALQEQYADFLNQPVKLTYGDNAWTPDLQELGVKVHFDEAVQSAFQMGHQASGVTSLRQIAAVYLFGYNVPLRVTIDQQAIGNYVEELATEIDRPATDAQVLLNNAQTEQVTAQPGRQVEVNDMVTELTAALQTLEPQTIPVRTRLLLPLLDAEDARQAQQALDTLLQAPITLEADGQTWELSVQDLSRMARIERQAGKDDEGDHLVVTLDRFLIQKKLEEIADATATGRVYPRLDWNGGDVKIIEAGEPGVRVDEAKAEEMIVEAAFSSERTVQLPFREAPPLVTEENIDDLGLEVLLAVGRSDFTGSEQYRITNIKAGMNLLHGLLIAPGEEFSFNRAIGSITADKGFVEGYAIVEDRTQLEWGGGICQDSTTLFRAIFWAGLPIKERWGHAFYISWYDAYGYGPYGDGPGMDATIYTGPGGPDLRFVNDTENWLLLQTHVNEAQALAEIGIYGTYDGREIFLEGPEITNHKPAPTEPKYVPNPDIAPGTRYRSDTARGGMDITFTRIVEKDGEVLRESEFVTKFQPWPNIYEMNPADLGPDGKPWPTATPVPTPSSQPFVPTFTNTEEQSPANSPSEGQPTPQPAEEPAAPQPLPTPEPQPVPQQPPPEQLPETPPEQQPILPPDEG